MASRALALAVAVSAGGAPAAALPLDCLFPRTCSGDLGCREQPQTGRIRAADGAAEFSLGGPWVPMAEVARGAPGRTAWASRAAEQPVHLLTVRANGVALLTLHAADAEDNGVALTLYGTCRPTR